MEDMLQDLKKKNIEVLFVNLLQQPRYMMERIDIIPDFIPKEHIFKGFSPLCSMDKRKYNRRILKLKNYVAHNQSNYKRSTR